ncbi:unnamed protein product [Closterium sp. NIES-54]
MPARELNSVRKLGTPRVSQATEAALRSVWQPSRLPAMTASAKKVNAGTSTPKPPTPCVPLTKLLGRRGLTGVRVLLALATTKASTLRGCTSTCTTAAATSTTTAAASTTSTAATEAPTPGTNPTTTATPSASSTSSTASPAAPSTTLAPLALAVAASPTTGRRSSDLLSANEPVAVDSGAIGGGGARGVGSEGVDGGGAVSRGAEPGGAEPGGIASGGGHQLPSHPHETLSPQQRHEWVVGRRADTGGTRSGGAEPGSADSGGTERGDGQPLLSRLQETLSPQLLREWVVRRRVDSAGAGSGGGGTRGTGAGGAEAAGAGGTGVGGKGAGGAGGSGTSGAGAGGTGARGTGGFSALGAAQPVPRRRLKAPQPLSLSVTATNATAATAFATAATAAPACCTAMALHMVLAFDHEGRPVQFDTWLDNLQLYLLSVSKDSVSLFDLASGAAPAPLATADSATRSQWLTRDPAARLAIRNHLRLTECAHFGQHRTAQALYAAVVARYSLPTTAALGCLLLPYLFLELSAFATVEDLVSHLRTSDARYCATIPAEFLDRNQPPMFITLYFIVTRLPDSLRSVRDHFLSLDPTSLTVDLLEQHLLAAETSAVAVGAPRGTPRTPFFEGCPPSPLTPSYASAAAAVDVLSTVARSTGSRSAEGPGAPCKYGRCGAVPIPSAAPVPLVPPTPTPPVPAAPPAPLVPPAPPPATPIASPAPPAPLTPAPPVPATSVLPAPQVAPLAPPAPEAPPAPTVPPGLAALAPPAPAAPPELISPAPPAPLAPPALAAPPGLVAPAPPALAAPEAVTPYRPPPGRERLKSTTTPVLAPVSPLIGPAPPEASAPVSPPSAAPESIATGCGGGEDGRGGKPGGVSKRGEWRVAAVLSAAGSPPSPGPEESEETSKGSTKGGGST